MRITMLVLNDMTGDARVEREARALASAGHDVTVLALKGPGLPLTETRDGYTISRVAESTTAKRWQFVAKWRQLRRREELLIAAAQAAAPHVVHANDTDTLKAASRASVATGAALVYDAHELYPDMISEFGWSRLFFVQAYWKRIERSLIPAAKVVFTVSEGLATELHRRYGVQPIVVRNVPRLVPIGDRDRLKRELSLPAVTKVALYQGGLIPGRGLPEMIRSMALVPDLHLVVQGRGSVECEMREVASALKVEDRVHFMGWINQGDLHDYASGADIGVVTYQPTTLNNILAAPNKLWSYRMAGLPVAASDLPGLRREVLTDGVGMLFDPESVDSLAGALRAMLADDVALRGMASRSRALAEARDNWDEEVGLFLGGYDLVLGGRS